MDADAPKERPEAWVVAAWALVAAEVALAIYLGLKRAGIGPIRAFVYGPPLLALTALGLGGVGVAWSFLRRPFLRPHRAIALCLLGFVIATVTYPLSFPSYRSTRPSSVRVGLPARGEWTVAWGGPGDKSFVMRTRPDRCYGFVFVLAREQVTRARPEDPRSAFAFGADVLAPCDGVVVRAVGELPDDGTPTRDDLGNHVVLEIAPFEYLFLAGLQQGSLGVALNERVTRGQLLARVGFSNASPLVPEPHLAMHVQDTPEPLDGQGIPFFFFDCTIDGERVARGVPLGEGLFAGHPVAGSRIRSEP